MASFLAEKQRVVARASAECETLLMRTVQVNTSAGT